MSTPLPPNRKHAAPDDSPHEPPASVVFMEMMRRVASASATADAAALAEAEAAQMAEQQRQADAAESALQAERQRDSQRRQDAALEAERLRRVQRRQVQRQQKRTGVVGGFIFTWFIVIVSGGLIATILSWATSPDSLSPQLRAEMGRANNDASAANGSAEAGAILPTAIPTPNYAYRIGIISGHSGPENDPGAVCPDGLTEAEINFAVAQKVWAQLVDRGYVVDLLEEFDRRLPDYRASLLVSIHANDCREYDGTATGYIVAQSDARPSDGPDSRLTECVAAAYGAGTPLERRYGLTRDMDGYHVFNTIHINTPATIIELGFMYRDREFLTTQTDVIASSIVQGVECFLHPSTALIPTTTPEMGQ